MHDEDLFDQLVDRWDECRQRGQLLSAEDLCRDCPELLAKVKKHIAVELAWRKFETPTPPTLEPLTPVGPYTPLKEVGRGGMGEIFLARDNKFGRKVALKRMQAHLRQRADKRRLFLREANITARLQHPGVVPIYDLVRKGEPWYAMRFIKGPTLLEAIERFHRRKRPPRDAAAWHPLLRRFVAVCETIAYAHSRGIIHRDIKPQNVVLGRFAETLVLDWGLAKRLTAATDSLDEADPSAAVTREWLPLQPDPHLGTVTVDTHSNRQNVTASGICTPGYASPEQQQVGGKIGLASDIYSLGATLYHLLTGKPPVPLVPARQLNRSVPPVLEAICMKALENRPEDRYATVEALAADVQAFMDDRPAKAWHEPWTVQARRWLRRHRTLATAGVVALLVAVLAGAALSIQQYRDNRQLGDAYSVLATKSDELTNTNDALKSKTVELGNSNLALEKKSGELKKSNDALGKKSDELSETNSQLAKKSLALANSNRELRLQRDELAAARDRLEQSLYVSSVHLADAELAAGRFSRAEDLLAECPQAPRQWEWKYLEHRVHQRLRTLVGHSADITAVACSPDGRLVASACGEWKDVDDIVGPGGFRSSGKRAVAYDVRVWDAAGGKLLKTFRRPEHGLASGLAFSPDGKYLAVAANDLTIWDLARGEVHLTVPDASRSVRYTADGQRLAALKSGKTAALWDAASGKELRTFDGGEGNIAALAISPDGARLAAAVDVSRRDDSERGQLKVWNAATGKLIFTASLRESGVKCVAFSPDGRLVAAPRSTAIAMTAAEVQVWNADTGKELFKLPGHADWISGVAFSPDGSRIATASDCLRLWSATDGAPVATLREHSSSVTAVAFGRDAQHLVTGGYDKTVKIWNLSAEDARALVPARAAAYFRRLAFSKDGRLLAAGGRSSVQIWDAASGKPRLDFDTDDYVSALAFDPQGRWLAISPSNHIVKLWSASQGKPVTTLADQDEGWSSTSAARVAFDPTGDSLAASTLHGSVLIWDAATGKVRRRIGSNFGSYENAVYSPDGKLLATCEWGRIHLFDPQTGNPRGVLDTKSDNVKDLAFSPDSRTLAVASYEGTIALWDLATNKPRATLRGHRGSVRGVAFSPDGKRIVSGGADGNVKLWDAATGAETLTLYRDPAGIEDVAFSPDGARIAAASGEGKVRIWDSEE